MKNLKMFCLTMEANHLDIIKKFNYIPVGLGNNNFNDEWFTDKSGDNISLKNMHYGEYTFHYWLWKNYIDKIDDKWIGFCQYRKFWSTKENNLIPRDLQQTEQIILKKIPDKLQKYETILGVESYVNKFKLMKFLKKGLRPIMKKPSYLFNSKKRNIKFHFDLMHGYGNLDKAIKLLDNNDKQSFGDFVNKKNSFNPHNMLICNSKKLLKDYYSIVFSWLKKCEEEFGFVNLSGYDQTRIYGFLAERFMSYWFQKNTNFTTLPIIYYDIKKDSN